MFWQQHRKQTNQEWKKRCCNLHSHWPDSTLNNKMLLDMTTHVVLRKFGVFKAQKTNPKNFISKVRLTISVFFPWIRSAFRYEQILHFKFCCDDPRLQCGLLSKGVCKAGLSPGFGLGTPPTTWQGIRVAEGGREKFSKENNMYEVATIVIERNHCFKSTCLTFKPVS